MNRRNHKTLDCLLKYCQIVRTEQSELMSTIKLFYSQINYTAYQNRILPVYLISCVLLFLYYRICSEIYANFVV